MSVKVPISALPLVSKSKSLQHSLIPDPVTPSHSQFKQILQNTPSVQRRARGVESSAHFSFVTPFLLPFPYRITADEESEQDKEVYKAAYIEKWLSAREALEQRPALPGHTSTSHLAKFSAAERDKFPSRNLLALSKTCLEDCLPHLHVGDAFDVLGSPALLPSDSPPGPVSSSSESDIAIRNELVDVLGCHTVLMSHEAENEYAPWSLRYCGHQFGVWAGQLGDGRAISILETPHHTIPDLQYEIQLKGAGRTPYSRSADGLAVLRSSIREYLCAEAMHALNIPTTRSLSLVHIPDLPVARETLENAAVVARMAPSFIRIGSFEAHNPPEDTFFFGMGGAQPKADYEALRQLGEWVVSHVLKLPRKSDDEPWGKALVWECARRNAEMVAGWQAYGFMHGVMNTDNISIMGLTMDYGPYAFMDVFSKNHICNHTDQEGRYAYQYQPTMILYALRKLLTAVGPLIGAELEKGKAVTQNWHEKASDSKLQQWKDKAKELQDDLDEHILDVFQEKYFGLMRKRLGLRTAHKDDAESIVNPLLTLMENHSLDFHRTFRLLSSFSPGTFKDERSGGIPDHVDWLAEKLVPSPPSSSSSSAQAQDLEGARRNVRDWLVRWGERALAEKDEAISSQRWAEEMRAANPRFVLRQWILEEVIKKCETDPQKGKQILAKVMEMACQPFKSWGDGFSIAEPADPEIREERRYCGVGDKDMLGFQCSCSS